MTEDFEPRLAARIMKLIPDAVDEGRVITQFVVAEADTGEPIIVFDAGKDVSPSLIGRRCLLNLKGLVIGEAERLGEERYELNGWNEIPNVILLMKQNRHTLDIHSIPETLNQSLSGRVMAVRANELLLDVGCGTVLVDHVPSFDPKPGWFIRATDIRFEFVGKAVLSVFVSSG